MRAIIIDRFGAPATPADLPQPALGPRDVRVRVQASSVNPIDTAVAAGVFEKLVPHDLPITLGRDFAGVVDEVGAEVTGVAVGERVFGIVPFNPPIKSGAWAQFLVLDQGHVARIPDGVDMQTAGVAPLSSISVLLAID